MSDPDQNRIVTVNGDGEPTQMEVYLELDVDERAYGLLIPLDFPIHLVETSQENGADVLEPVDEATVQKLRGELNSAIRDWGLKSESRPDGLFLVGEPDDEFLEDCDFIGVRTDDGEEEEYAVLVQLETGDNTYLVITPTTPELVPVEFTSTDSARHLEDSELGDLEETFHAALRAVEDAE
ncbi:MAG: hypothetical protein CMH52_08245 [Myxococcales bacterium]|nr:hypothetical protein [Myxococcales bacterium]